MGKKKSMQLAEPPATILQQQYQPQPQSKSEQIKYQFLTNIHSKHLNCKLCTSLMLQPLRLHRCGHTFCQSCVGNNKVKECPTCLQKIVAKQRDILAVRLVGQLPVQCLNTGCPWKGSFEQYSNFHKQGCRLKEGGIDGWLNELKNTINQNSLGFGGLGATINSDGQNSNPEDKLQKVKQDSKQNEYQNRSLSPERVEREKKQQNTEKKINSYPRSLKYPEPQYNVQKRMKQLDQFS